jgi:hypothetical protein
MANLSHSELKKIVLRGSGAVSYAIKKGTLTRPDHCEMCGCKCKPHGHHDSYDKDRLLTVAWLCQKCHMSLHSQDRRSHCGRCECIRPVGEKWKHPHNWYCDDCVDDIAYIGRLVPVPIPPEMLTALRAEAAAKDWTLGRLIVSRLQDELACSRMGKVCAWCGIVIRHGKAGHGITHGICQECVHMERAKL